MATHPNMGLVDPTRGALGEGIWHDAIDANSAIIDAHDHTSSKGARVPSAGIDINADLTFDGLYAPINLHRLTFSSIISITENKSLFVLNADNELYWRSNTGANVKLTSGNALNVAAFTGGFGGDYVTSAAAAYDAAGARFTFKKSTGEWTRIASSDVRLFEHGSTESVYVALTAPAALGSSYTITMPTALPSSKQPMQIDASGIVTAEDVVAHGERKITLGPPAFIPSAAATSYSFGTVPETDSFLWRFTAAGTGSISAPVALPVGTRIKTITWRFNKVSNASALTMLLSKLSATSTKTSLSTTSDVSSGASIISVTTAAINYTIEDDYAIMLDVTAGATAHQFLSATITYDRPS